MLPESPHFLSDRASTLHAPPSRPDHSSQNHENRAEMGFGGSGGDQVSIFELPDRLRSIFPHPFFNMVQSRCFEVVYRTDDNIVLSAPTGSGKTGIFELAICRLINSGSPDFKVVYQAPTKALCAERRRDWSAKFGPLGLQCMELTGDSDHAHSSAVQKASIIITTPEKWDSVTRKWKDHRRLAEIIKLFLIDEVHILRESRGATLEAVVSRMKSIGSRMRFIALSATVPNAQDVAEWLGRSGDQRLLPAHMFSFGDEARTTSIKRVVHGIRTNTVNEFAVDKIMDSELPGLIAKYCARKPIMIFCMTRSICESTAKHLAGWWTGLPQRDRFWAAPYQADRLDDATLASFVTCGVAYHHAGISQGDRHTVEALYLAGHINVICCTSTLAVGINLPCYLVIVKNTCTWIGTGVQEYPSLDISQMIGRAGRPQFETSAVAVIMTKADKAERYTRLMFDERAIESCLHLNLVEHLNAEVGLRTVYDLESGKRWMASTFLWTRLKKNPGFYHISCSKSPYVSPQDTLEEVVRRSLSILCDAELLVEEKQLLICTPYGDAMAKFCVRFATMQRMLELAKKAPISAIVTALSQAYEFEDVYLRSGQRGFYKELNKASAIKYPVKLNFALTEHKVSVIIQAKLGSATLPSCQAFVKQKSQFNIDTEFVFSHLDRLIRCLIECRIHAKDATTVRNGLELCQSVNAGAWTSPALQLGHVSGIGPVALRKLTTAGITTLDQLVDAEPSRIEMILSRNPPFGTEILKAAELIPRMMLSMAAVGRARTSEQAVTITIRVQVGTMNSALPSPILRNMYVIFMAERSDGFLVDFRRTSIEKVNRCSAFDISAGLQDPQQSITGYLLCESIPGSRKHAILHPRLLPLDFTAIRGHDELRADGLRGLYERHNERDVVDTRSRLQNEEGNGDVLALKETSPTDSPTPQERVSSSPRFRISEDLMFDDADFIDLADVESSADQKTRSTRSPCSNIEQLRRHQKRHRTGSNSDGEEEGVHMLANGNYMCKHNCKDKQTCKHLCCHEGLDHPPKKTRKMAKATHQLMKSVAPEPAPQRSQMLMASIRTNQDLPSYNSAAIGDSSSPLAAKSRRKMMDVRSILTQRLPDPGARTRDPEIRPSRGPYFQLNDPIKEFDRRLSTDAEHSSSSLFLHTDGLEEAIQDSALAHQELANDDLDMPYNMDIATHGDGPTTNFLGARHIASLPPSDNLPASQGSNESLGSLPPPPPVPLPERDALLDRISHEIYDLLGSCVDFV